jgi:hypothetical protein
MRGTYPGIETRFVGGFTDGFAGDVGCIYRTSEQLAETRSGWTLSVGAWDKRISRAYQAGDAWLAPWLLALETYHESSRILRRPDTFQLRSQRQASYLIIGGGVGEAQSAKRTTLGQAGATSRNRTRVLHANDRCMRAVVVTGHVHTRRLRSLGPQRPLRDPKSRAHRASSSAVFPCQCL